MTYQTEEEAQDAGIKARRRMKSKGWTVRVWENLGWHFELLNAPLSVHEGSSGFFAFVADKPDKAGFGAGVWSHHLPDHADPNMAVRDAVRAMVDVVRQHAADYNPEDVEAMEMVPKSALAEVEANCAAMRAALESARDDCGCAGSSLACARCEERDIALSPDAGRSYQREHEALKRLEAAVRAVYGRPSALLCPQAIKDALVDLDEVRKKEPR